MARGTTRWWWGEGRVTGIRRERVEAQAEDGWRLRGDALTPPFPKACAVLGHAMMVDRRTMDHPRGEGLASTLAAGGIAVLSFDLRGHGESGPSVHEGGRWSYDDIVRRDVPALVALGRARHPDLPVTLVGHSLAGHAAMISAGLLPDHAPDAIVGLAPNLWAPRFEPSLRRRLLKGAMMLGWAATSAPFGRFESRRFGMGSAAEPWSYVRQLVRFYLRNELRSADGHDDYLGALRRVEVPVLAVSSEGDRLLAGPSSVDRWIGEMRRALVTHRVVRDADVSPPPDHMGLVMSPRMRCVWEEIALWIREHAG